MKNERGKIRYGMINLVKFTTLWLLASLFCLVLLACSSDEKIGVSYHAYNHTDNSIVSIIINGEGGILDATAHGEGGGVCCVVLPKRWRPGLMVKVKWQLDGDWLKDGQGKEVIRDGKKVFVPGPWKEKTVEVPKYDEEMGLFFIHFFPGDKVNVLVNRYGAGHSTHPYLHPEDEAKGEK
ncbi:MAG: DUF3304 domain-containing protein [Spirochaetia bacterium]|nr:DUF3304 domain-containing protein [Spirochaetia bacterium]